MLGKVRGWADKARCWTTYWLMRAALKLHEETFIIMCRMCAVDQAMREQGVAKLVVEENDEGELKITPVYHNTTRH